MKCVRCGKEIAENSRFCRYCGGEQNLGTASKTANNYSADMIDNGTRTQKERSRFSGG